MQIQIIEKFSYNFEKSYSNKRRQYYRRQISNNFSNQSARNFHNTIWFFLTKVKTEIWDILSKTEDVKFRIISQTARNFHNIWFFRTNDKTGVWNIFELRKIARDELCRKFFFRDFFLCRDRTERRQCYYDRVSRQPDLVAYPDIFELA